MGLVNRFFNIVKSYSASNHNYSDIEKEFTDYFLDDTSDETLEQEIDNLNKEKDFFWPADIKNAFKILDIEETKDINKIKSAFKKKILLYHPDKNINKSVEEQKILKEKTNCIIIAFNLIKSFLLTNKDNSQK